MVDSNLFRAFNVEEFLGRPYRSFRVEVAKLVGFANTPEDFATRLANELSPVVYLHRFKHEKVIHVVFFSIYQKKIIMKLSNLSQLVASDLAANLGTFYFQDSVVPIACDLLGTGFYLKHIAEVIIHHVDSICMEKLIWPWLWLNGFTHVRERNCDIDGELVKSVEYAMKALVNRILENMINDRLLRMMSGVQHERK